MFSESQDVNIRHFRAIEDTFELPAETPHCPLTVCAGNRFFDVSLLWPQLRSLRDVVKQVMSDPSGGAMFVSDPKKPAGGHVIAHASTIRLSLRKGKAEQRVMKVTTSYHDTNG
jgi:hypothetical protein